MGLQRDRLRSVVPTPLMYVRRSVMILEPMSSHSAQAREREERAKYVSNASEAFPQQQD